MMGGESLLLVLQIVQFWFGTPMHDGSLLEHQDAPITFFRLVSPPPQLRLH